MSAAYTTGGKRRSAMTHASRGHKCDLCSRTVFGNGGQVSHGRGHVKRGEAVELIKHYGTYPPMSTRLFLAVNDERIARFITEGFEKVSA